MDGNAASGYIYITIACTIHVRLHLDHMRVCDSVRLKGIYLSAELSPPISVFTLPIPQTVTADSPVVAGQDATVLGDNFYAT